jgi:MFS family permease
MDGMGRLQRMGRALRYRNYRLYFMGQSVSLVGTWLTQVAMSWLVYRLTDSAFLLGVVSFAAQAPTFFLAPIAGVWVDRLSRHRTLIFTQVLAMVQSGLLAYFALAGSIDVPHIVALAAMQGFINAVDIPLRQSFVVELIEDRTDLANAVALNSSMVNAARLVGPSLAGFLIALVGEGMCFLIDALSYIAVIGSLMAMRVPARKLAHRRRRVWHELHEGFRYAYRYQPIRALLLLLAVTGLVGMPYTALMPVVARNVLAGGAGTLGALMACSGLGALSAALYLASRHTVVGLGRLIALGASLFGLSLAGLALSRTLVLSLAFMFVCGMSVMVQMASTNTILQTIVEEDKRGRVMALYSMAVFGTTPFGSLLAGRLADHIGAPPTLAICGGIVLLGGIWFSRELPELRDILRPLYRRLGILPELAQGVAEATKASVPPPA